MNNKNTTVILSRGFCPRCKNCGLLPYGAFALRGFCPTTTPYIFSYQILQIWVNVGRHYYQKLLMHKQNMKELYIVSLI